MIYDIIHSFRTESFFWLYSPEKSIVPFLCYPAFLYITINIIESIINK